MESPSLQEVNSATSVCVGSCVPDDELSVEHQETPTVDAPVYVQDQDDVDVDKASADAQDPPAAEVTLETGIILFPSVLMVSLFCR